VLQDGDVSFDYLLKEGRANSRNAIRLLEVIGFDKEVVKRSQQRVDRFLQKGIWE
jgi:DNA mismatch repair ATPase MutS